MRIAPCALVKEWDPYDLGCRVAAITHGHHSGYLAAGALALIIRAVLEGKAVANAASGALARLVMHPGGEECITALRNAISAMEDRRHGGQCRDARTRVGGGRGAGDRRVRGDGRARSIRGKV